MLCNLAAAAPPLFKKMVSGNPDPYNPRFIFNLEGSSNFLWPISGLGFRKQAFDSDGNAICVKRSIAARAMVNLWRKQGPAIKRWRKQSAHWLVSKAFYLSKHHGKSGRIIWASKRAITFFVPALPASKHARIFGLSINDKPSASRTQSTKVAWYHDNLLGWFLTFGVW